MNASPLSTLMNWNRIVFVSLLAAVLIPSANADLPYPAELLPQEQSLAAYGKAVTDDMASGLTPTARLAVIINGPIPFDFGPISGDATMEFILNGNPNLGTGSAYLAVGTNAGSNLRYEQWNNTGELGFTHIGLGDYRFSPPVYSPTSPTVVTYVWNDSARVMSLYLDGQLAGTRGGIVTNFSMPSGQGWLMSNPAGIELMYGTIYRMTVYNSQVSPDVIERHARAYLNHGQRLPSGGGAVAIDGDYAAVAAYPGTDIYHREDYGWRHLGSLDWWASSLALQGDTLVMGELDSGIPPSRGRALVYVRSEELGLNAWHLRDGDSSLAPTFYQVDVSPEMDQVARTNGWRYRLVSRFVDDYRSGVCMMFLYGDGTRRYLVYFDLDDNGDLAVELFGANPLRRVLTTGGTGTAGYHSHELVFNPTNQMVTYLFDGTPIHTWAGDAASNDGIFWGSGSTSGQGAINVHRAEFEILQGGPVLASYDAGTGGNPATAPDPVSVGWSLGNANDSLNSARRPLSPDLETVWRRQGDLRASDGAPGIGTPNDGFGSSVDLSGDTIVVGAPYDDISNTADTGSAYVFVRNGSTWTEQQKIVPSVRSVNDYFGQSVAIDGDSVIVGAPNRYFGTQTNPGRAFVFTRSGTLWAQQGAPLVASDGAARETFGYAVDIDGNRAAISAATDAHSSRTFAGSVYIFERNGAAWTQQAKMIANPVSSGLFGTDVALRGDVIVVAENEGSRHFVFTRNGAGDWTQRQLHTYGESRIGAVDFDGTRLIVSTSVVEADQGENAAYIYEPDYAAAAAVAAYARATLYYPDATSPQSSADPNLAAFRYKHLLYGQSNGLVRARFENMASLYGENERRRATEAEDVLSRGLSLNPDSPLLGNLLLDICYDRTVAETILTKDLAATTELARFGPQIPNGFLIDNEIALYRRVEATNRFALQCYFDLLKKELLVQQILPPSTRWAARVLGFSTEFTSSSWSAAQALGDPDTYPQHDDIATAWASASPDDQREFLEFGYDDPRPINSVSIYETYNPGAVDKVSVRHPNTGQWQEVWAGTAAPAGATARIFTVTFPLTSFSVDAIRIDLNSPAVPDWNEIDAVGISGPGRSSTTTDATFGYRVFQTLVPQRGLAPATYTNASGQDVVVTTNAAALTNGMLYAGYKDLVLLFDLLRDYGRSANTLGRLLAGRNNPGDADEAKALIAQAQRFLFLQGSLLKNTFPALPPPGDPSGLAEAIAGWEESLNAFETLRAVLAGDVNLLGFAPDFLMLIENFQDPLNPRFDSFDSFQAQLSSVDSPLARAVDQLQFARVSYSLYRGYEDQVEDQFDQSADSYGSRLFEIVGARPNQPNYVDNPTNNPGSELDQQYRSIEIARLRILKNSLEISNLVQQVNIEIARAGSVSNTVIKYGNKQASIARTIGHINATQAAMDGLADTFSPEKLLKGAVIFGLLNTVVQAGGEEAKGQLEGKKEELASRERAELDGIESDARVKTLLLGMSTLVVDSLEAGQLLQQEVARLAGLYREKADLEGRIAERNASIASRYFADPIHRVTAEYSQILANLDFADAQRWIFFMTRALEYKWNTPFANFQYPPGGRVWSAASLFKLRNADELDAFYDAMLAFDALINRGKTYRFDWFSVREDFMGLKQTNELGQLAMYTDPQTGRSLDAISLFRTNLLRTARAVQGGQEIVLEFNTVRQIPGGFFFVGPTFDLAGNVINKGRFLDKIDYLQIRLPGSHSLGRPQLAGNLTYGGTSFIRNFNVGHFDPLRADRLIDELTAYSTRYWFYDPTANQMRWRFNEGLTIDSVEMQLTADPRIPPTVNQIEEFKERSVAATGWKLTIPLRQQNVDVMRINELNDVEIYFHHYSAQRQ